MESLESGSRHEKSTCCWPKLCADGRLVREKDPVTIQYAARQGSHEASQIKSQSWNRKQWENEVGDTILVLRLALDNCTMLW